MFKSFTDTSCHEATVDHGGFIHVLANVCPTIQIRMTQPFGVAVLTVGVMQCYIAIVSAFPKAAAIMLLECC